MTCGVTKGADRIFRLVGPVAAALLVLLGPAAGADALDAVGVARCVAAGLGEKTAATLPWSGRSIDGGCSIVAERHGTAVLLTGWAAENTGRGWIRIAIATLLTGADLKNRARTIRAGRELTAGAGRIQHCLEPAGTRRRPEACLTRTVQQFHLGEDSGFEQTTVITLRDNGRHIWAEYAMGDTPSAPQSPLILPSAALLPGLDPEQEPTHAP